MDLTTQPQSYNAKQLDASKRKQLALDAIKRNQPINRLAEAKQVSRQFVYKQRDKAIDAVSGVTGMVDF